VGEGRVAVQCAPTNRATSSLTLLSAQAKQRPPQSAAAQRAGRLFVLPET